MTLFVSSIPCLAIALKPLVVIAGWRIAPCIVVADTLPQSFDIGLREHPESRERWQMAGSLGIKISLAVCPLMVGFVFLLIGSRMVPSISYKNELILLKATYHVCCFKVKSTVFIDVFRLVTENLSCKIVQ